MNRAWRSRLIPLFLTLSLFSEAKHAPVAHWIYGKDLKETVVLIHGFNTSHLSFDPLIPKLSKRFQVVVYDQPGHGASPATGEDYSPRQMAVTLKALLDELKIEKAHLVGHSMGGRTAVKFTSLYPKMVASLLVEDMNLLSEPQSKKELPRLRANYERVRDAIPSTFANRDAAVVSLSRFYNETEILFILSGAKTQKDGTLVLGYRPEATALYLAEGLALDMTEELKSVHVPLAFFAADHLNETAVLKKVGLDHIRAIRPDALLKEFPGSGHTIHDRDDFAEALIDFLTHLPNADSGN